MGHVLLLLLSGPVRLVVEGLGEHGGTVSAVDARPGVWKYRVPVLEVLVSSGGWVGRNVAVT